MKKQVTYSMQLLSFILVAFFLMSFVETTSAQKPNFAGSWAFNETKSDQPQGGGRGFGGGGTLNIKQDANSITVERVTVRDGEPRTNTSKYTLDGKESVNTTQRGTSKSIAKWASDNKSVNISTISTYEMNGETRNTNSNEVWTLTDGGKSLTITSTRPNQDGEPTTTKRVYDKK